jgi:uncharacterized protein with HEPN domain
MDQQTRYRLNDVIRSIEDIDELLIHKGYEAFASDKIMKAALERFLEILSEASRHVPNSMKNSRPDIPWRRIADIGNHIRHAYHRVDSEILWEIHASGNLKQLHAAVTSFLSNE